jgi:hypothetical protein
VIDDKLSIKSRIKCSGEPASIYRKLGVIGMNKKKLLSSVAATALLVGIASQGAQAADTATGTAQAQILAAITIDPTPGIIMNFGDISPDTGAATTVTLDSAGGTTASGSTIATGTPSAGSFDVTGNDVDYSIDLPADGVVLTSGGNTMTVDAFTDSYGGTDASPATGTIAGGTDTFTVGATLNVGAAQAAGTYTGTYDVTVEYQ